MSDYTLHEGDCIDAMAGMDENSKDAIVTDPPAGIAFMGRNWDDLTGHGAKTERGRMVAPALDILQAAGTLQAWEAGFLLFTVDWASEALRVAKPGAHSLTWALPRSSDLTKFGLRLAGWEIRDVVHHIFASGFPKSMAIDRAIDRYLGKSDEREVIGVHPNPNGVPFEGTQSIGGHWQKAPNITAPATPEAARHVGMGTALKPAVEEWILARKPINGTIAANVLQWGTGGLNIDACRVPIDDGATMARNNKPGDNGWKNSSGGQNSAALNGEPAGRWPANLVLDDSEIVRGAFPVSTSGGGDKHGSKPSTFMASIDRVSLKGTSAGGDTGSAARFFFCAKASQADRSSGGEFDNDHPTVKSLELMRYLCALICPPDGTILDPFMGSGSTGVAARELGFGFDGIEKNPHNLAIARKRIDKSHRRMSGQARKVETTNHGDLPLFSMEES